MMNRTWQARSLAVILAACFLITEFAVAVGPAPELPDPGRTSVTKEQQEQVGLQAMGEVYKQMPVLPDNSPETQYIQQVGKKLASVIPQQNSWPWQFHVIPQKEINAFALPGGPMFVNVGTITSADNEAQLAGVMAHEMAHVYMQHSAKQMGKSQGIGLLAGLAGAILGGSNSLWAGLAKLGIQIGAGTVMMKYSREDEAQADAVGAIILWKAGYNPKAMADFFQKLAGQGGGGPQFLSDHPNPGNREAAIEKEIANWPQKNYQQNSQQFLSARQHAKTLQVYDQQQIAQGAKSGQWERQNRQGGSMPASVQNNGRTTQSGGQISNVSLPQVRPSGSMQQYQNQGFAISYPSNWSVVSEDQGSVTIAPKSGVSQNSIAYGVVVNGPLQPRQPMSIDDMTQQIISNLQQSNPDMQQVGDPQTIRINGATGRSVDLVSTSPVTRSGQQMKERDWLVTVPTSNGGVIFLVFIAPQNDFDQLRPAFQNMLKSLRM